jgi:hypothetical protein
MTIELVEIRVVEDAAAEFPDERLGVFIAKGNVLVGELGITGVKFTQAVFIKPHVVGVARVLKQRVVQHVSLAGTLHAGDYQDFRGGLSIISNVPWYSEDGVHNRLVYGIEFIGGVAVMCGGHIRVFLE